LSRICLELPGFRRTQLERLVVKEELRRKATPERPEGQVDREPLRLGTQLERLVVKEELRRKATPERPEGQVDREPLRLGRYL